MLAAAPASSDAGPSVSGKPCPRLTAPVSTASREISVKIVEVNGRMRSTSMGRPYPRPGHPAATSGADRSFRIAGAGCASHAPLHLHQNVKHTFRRVNRARRPG